MNFFLKVLKYIKDEKTKTKNLVTAFKIIFRRKYIE